LDCYFCYGNKITSNKNMMHIHDEPLNFFYMFQMVKIKVWTKVFQFQKFVSLIKCAPIVLNSFHKFHKMKTL
jgi:hypothetical protein